MSVNYDVMHKECEDRELYPTFRDRLRCKAKEVDRAEGERRVITKERALYDTDEYKAFMARAAYINSWNRADRDGREDLPNTHWEYQEGHSDMRRAVWYNKLINTVVISYRGTSIDDPIKGGGLSDLATDVTIAFNYTGVTPMYRYDIKHFKQVKAAFPTAKIEVVGHSLGGHRARTIGEAFGVPSFGVNEGATPLVSGQTMARRIASWFKPSLNKHNAVRVGGDPISLFAPVSTGKVETRAYPIDTKYSWLNAHTDAMRTVFAIDDKYKVCSLDKQFCI